MSFLSPQNPQAARAAAATTAPMPPGYSLSPITPETVGLFKKAGVKLDEILPIVEAFQARMRSAGTPRARDYWAAKLFAKISPILFQNPRSVKILTWILVTDSRRVKDVLALGDDCFFAEVQSQFARLGPGEFGALTFHAAVHLSKFLYDGGLKGGGS